MELGYAQIVRELRLNDSQAWFVPFVSISSYETITPLALGWSEASFHSTPNITTQDGGSVADA